MTSGVGPPPELEVRIRLELDRYELRAELDVGPGVTGIFGPSGAGKSALLETVAGLRRRARGRIALGGDVWLDTDRRLFVPPERRHVGYVPQEGLLFPHWNVRHNLLAGRRRAHHERARHERARHDGHRPETTFERVVGLLELGPLLDRSPVTLSGGERQRVALGRALCSGPRLLLLDEPLAALDMPLRRRLLPFLRRIRDELTVPMLLISHDPNEVQALCDDLVFLRDGKIVARGPPRVVLTDPAIYPLAAHQGFENVLSGRVVRSEGGVSVVRLGTGDAAVELVALPSEAEGTDVLVGLPASDIMIATEPPRGLSARNVVPARLLELRPLERHVLVTAEMAAGLPPVTIEVTEATPAKLGLEPGAAVYLVIKATSCRIYGSGR